MEWALQGSELQFTVQIVPIQYLNAAENRSPGQGNTERKKTVHKSPIDKHHSFPSWSLFMITLSFNGSFPGNSTEGSLVIVCISTLIKPR